MFEPVRLTVPEFFAIHTAHLAGFHFEPPAFRSAPGSTYRATAPAPDAAANGPCRSGNPGQRLHRHNPSPPDRTAPPLPDTASATPAPPAAAPPAPRDGSGRRSGSPSAASAGSAPIVRPRLPAPHRGGPAPGAATPACAQSRRGSRKGSHAPAHTPSPPGRASRNTSWVISSAAVSDPLMCKRKTVNCALPPPIQVKRTQPRRHYGFVGAVRSSVSGVMVASFDSVGLCGKFHYPAAGIRDYSREDVGL